MKKVTDNLFNNFITKYDLDNKLIKINKIFLDLLNEDKSKILGKEEKEFLNILHSSKNINNDTIYDEIIKLNNDILFFKTKKELIITKRTSYIKITRINISEFKKYFTLFNDHKKLLANIAKGKPINLILHKIIKSVEKRNHNIICSILLLDESKKRLINGASPSLPDFYNEKLENMEIGEKIGSCGAAVYLKQRVIVENIQTHENWKYAKNLASKVGLKACWSQPFFSSSKEVLGSFAIYYKTTKKPTSFDIKMIEDIANITGIAVEKHNLYLKRKKDEKERAKKEEILMHKTKQAMMGEMLENIAHQWRQPLSVISTYATGILMKKKYGIDTKELEDEAFENINLNAQYLSNTINDFREYFTKIKEKNSFNIMDLYEHTFKLIDSRVKNEDIKIIKSIESSYIVSYENELIQILINIFNNAIDVLLEVQKDDRYIYLESYIENNFLIIKINDSGKGANENIIKRIFEPYFTTKEQKLGTGIGLYMSKDIIEKHLNGSISAKNNSFTFKGKTFLGLEFEIRIPNLKPSKAP